MAVKLTAEEKDRLCEVLFLKYFQNKPKETLGDAKFWNCIHSICQAYGIDSAFITRCTRILLAKENAPSDYETWYLFWKLNTPVRPMKGFTGIYWQKQKKFEEDYSNGVKPHVYRRITDVALKRSMHSFVNAIFDIFGSYKYLNTDTLNEIFGA